MNITVDGVKYVPEDQTELGTLKIGAINIEITKGGVTIWHDDRHDQEMVEITQGSNGWIHWTNVDGRRRTIMSCD